MSNVYAIIEANQGGDGKEYLVHSALNFQDPRAGSIWPQIYQTMKILELTDDFVSEFHALRE
jgi:hypothetical protein